jgi:hypothetical protein
MMEKLLGAFDAAGLEVGAEDVLDMLWLASRGRALSLAADDTSPPPAPASPSASQPGPAPLLAKAAPPEQAVRPGAEEEIPVYAAGAAASDRTVKAAPVAIPAGRALGNALPLMRALRPFVQRWPSRRDLEIDEERTVQVTAELGLNGPHGIYPVFRPRGEPWYDVHLVAEDDPAIVLWDDTIRDVSRLLERIGAFRVVESWRLRVGQLKDVEADAVPTVSLESRAGARLPFRILAGADERRLIVFVTHGASQLWRDGTYARVLAPWLRHASVVLLHLLPRERWQHTPLGDAAGLCFAGEPGLPSSRLSVEPFWWQLSEADPATLLAVPAMSLDPALMGEWAGMQMARGRHSPVFLLDPRPSRDSIPAVTLASRRDFERAIAQLRERAPEAFRLAIYLAPGEFTIPVARLIQEATIGRSADPSLLGELFLSGLVFTRDGTGEAGSVGDGRFAFWPQAREILMESLRDQDTRTIAAELERRVSQHIMAISNRTVSFKALVPRADGTYDLPDWAQPFAKIANSLVSLPEESAAALVGAFVASTTPRRVSFAARLASSHAPLDPTSVDPDLWQALASSRLIQRFEDGLWRFLPGVAEELDRLVLASVPAAAQSPPESASGRAMGARSTRVRMYRQGFGDCFLVSLPRPSSGDYTILVNCGVLLGTPDAMQRMRVIATDIVATTGGRIDILIVTHSNWTKVAGFDYAYEVFRRMSVEQVLVGWWEDPNDSLGRKLRRRSGARSQQALERAKALGKSLIFLDPSTRIDLGGTGARLFCLGAPRDELIIRQTYPDGQPGMDFAIDLPGHDVLLFTDKSGDNIWRSPGRVSLNVHDGTALDLLSDVVFCKARLLASEEALFREEGMRWMPRLRVLAIPVDREMMLKKRWTPPQLGGIYEVLRLRAGVMLRSDVTPEEVPPNVTVSDLWFEVSFDANSRRRSHRLQ